VDEPLHCYRHPNRETYLTCSECGRPICTDCMRHAPVGIRCPEHANIGAPRPSAVRTARQVRGTIMGHPAPATTALIGLNVLVYLITVGQGGGLGSPGGSLYDKGALVGSAVGHGDYWRLVTAMFLHAGLLHIASNMFALWIIGTAVEYRIGTERYLLLYFVSGLAGSAGALVFPLLHSGGTLTIHYYPDLPTVGASGAIFGMMGAWLVLDYLATGSLAGQAMTLIVLNLVLSLAIPNISVGGHAGGLVGGILGTLALMKTRYRRQRWLGPALVAAVGVVSVVLAIARARGTI
jgi:membrane associated rhomboid family serine protease